MAAVEGKPYCFSPSHRRIGWPSLRDLIEWVSLFFFSLSFQSLCMGPVPEYPFQCVSYIPFRDAAWSFDKTLKSQLSSNHSFIMLGSSQFCLWDWNFCSVPSFMWHPSSSPILSISPPHLWLRPQLLYDFPVCISPFATLLLLSFFGSVVLPSIHVFWSKQCLFSYRAKTRPVPQCYFRSWNESALL